MKKSRIAQLASLAFVSAFTIQSCNNDDDEVTPTPPKSSEEFIADDSTFVNYMSWSLDATAQGADPAIGSTHGGNDSTVVRNVYFKDGQDPVNGKYPLGTIIVKHSYNADSSLNELTAMVKRGNDYNPKVGDWEFFMLHPNGSIALDSTGSPMRGAQLMGGICGGCHSSASSSDFVFSK